MRGEFKGFLAASAMAFTLVAGGPAPVLAADTEAESEDAVEDVSVGDPLEGLNRLIFEFNEIVYTLVLGPAASAYEAFLPPPMREGIENVISNLKTPVYLANDLLQGEGGRAWETTQRFFINSTYGIAGIVDRAEEMGIEKHKEDFGQTLGAWGVGEGFYLVLPILGPSSPRDAIGKYGVDPFFDLAGFYIDEDAALARLVVGGVAEYADKQDELDKIKKTSVDYYAAIRSMYRQKREAEIRNGEPGVLPPIPDISYDFEDEEDELKGELPAAGK